MGPRAEVRLKVGLGVKAAERKNRLGTRSTSPRQASGGQASSTGILGTKDWEPGGVNAADEPEVARWRGLNPRPQIRGLDEAGPASSENDASVCEIEDPP